MTRFALSLLVLVGLAACGDVVQKSVDAPIDPCPGATCECTAATEAMDCGAHQVCDESGGNRICKCAAAYTTNGDGTCTFAGGPADPGFQDPTKWSVVGTAGVMVIPAAPGKVQPGELSIDRAGLCQFAGAKQTFTMPPFDRADSLKVSITHTVVDPNFDFPFGLAVQVGIGGQWVEFVPQRGAYKTSSFCLGPAAFGGAVDFRIGVVNTTSCTPASAGSVRIDELKLEIAAPGECPKQAGVVNGDFQLATGWLFPNQQSGAGQTLPNIGENGSFAAQLTQPNRCSEVTALGTISIPPEAKVAHPALDVYWNGTSNTRLAVQLNGKNIGTLNANGQIKHSRVCIPKWATGNVTSFGLFAQRVSNNNCAAALNRTFILDNMTIVDEPACGTLSDLTDPSFERIANAAGPMPGWGQINGIVNDIEGSRTFVLNSAGNASSGVGVLRTSNSNPCVGVGEGGGDFAAIVPPAQGAAGPAIKFAAKADVANVNSETRATLLPLGQGVPQKVVAETGAYTQNVLCIPPNLIGRLINVRLSTGDPDGGGCAPTAYEEFGFFDDVSVTTDASCPAQ